MSPTLIAMLRPHGFDSAGATAIMAATFHEVWWMARFHTSTGSDIHAWLADIVTRRATDRSRDADRPPLVAEAGDETWTTTHDRHLERTLSALFEPPPAFG